MQLLSIVLLGIAASLDNLGLGLAYGVKKIRIPFTSNLIIALISGITNIIFSFSGQLLTKIFPAHFGNIIGSTIVILVGIWTIYSYYKDKDKYAIIPCPSKEIIGTNLQIICKDPAFADVDYSGHISTKESLLLGFALGLNCIVTGLGAGMAGLNIWAMSALVAVFSFVTISIGFYIGRKYVASFLGNKATLVAGIFLILIGIYEFF